MMAALDAFRIVLDVAVFYVVIRLFGWMALVAPRAFWRGWKAENRGSKDNPYKFGTWDYSAFEEGWEGSRENEPGP